MFTDCNSPRHKYSLPAGVRARASGTMPVDPGTNVVNLTILDLAMMLRVVGPAGQQPGLCALCSGDLRPGLHFVWDGDAD